MVPFSNHNSPAATLAILSGKRPQRPTRAELTDGLWKLMNRCWNKDRHNRPLMLEVLLALHSRIRERTHPRAQLPFTADVQTQVPDIRQRLESLDASNEEYRPLLYALLSHRDLGPHINSLQKDDLEEFVKLLDEVGKAQPHLHLC